MGRLRSDEYAYKSEETTELLVGLIYYAMHSLSRINAAEWSSFLVMFRDAKQKALARTKNDTEKTANYNGAVSLLLATFEKYIHYLRSIDGPVVRQMNTAG
jgi:hypothetical protein